MIVLIILRRVIFFCAAGLWVSVTYGPAAPLVTGVCEGRTTSICLHPPAIDFTELPKREKTNKNGFCVQNAEKQLEKCPVKQQYSRDRFL